MTVHKRQSHGIFRTQEEPIFNRPQCSDFPHILQESLINIATHNVLLIQHADSKQGLFRQGAAANFLFIVCEKLRLSHQVKFVAIELFDRFMQKHIEELYNHVYTSSSPVEQKHSDWQNILERVRKQLYLRIVSCCQIASKLISHYKVISVSKAKRFLVDMGHNYTSHSILQSELRILKTLDFHIAVLSPLDYLETILQVLAHNTVAMDLPVSMYQSWSVKLLTVLHLKCENIYLDLLCINSHIPSLSSEDIRCQLSEVQADKLLMAAGVLAAAVYISDQQHLDVVTEHLHRITQIPCEHIEDFVTALLREIQTTPDP